MTLETAHAGPVQACVYRAVEPDSAAPLVLVFHGGGFDGTLPRDCPFAEAVARTGAIVVMPDYNLPFGNVFPNPLKTGFSVFSYLAKKRSGLGGRKSPLFVGGIESGGNIAAAVALKVRDYSDDVLDGQILASPLLDPFMASLSIREADAIEMREKWSNGWSHYLSGGMCHPYAAPSTCSRLAGLAPALLLTAEDDPLRNETLDYAAALESSGVPVHRRIFPAGAGWPTLYGAKTVTSSIWQDDAAASFTAFAKAIQAH